MIEPARPLTREERASVPLLLLKLLLKLALFVALFPFVLLYFVVRASSK